MNTKKTISPVVATALLIVVAVGAVIGFQNFFQSYSSSIFSDVEGENSIDNSLRVEGIFTDILYLKSGEYTNLSVLKIVDESGNEMCSFSGSSEVNSSGLVGLWKLDDENSTIVDLSGNGNNGKLYGNTRLLVDFDDETATDRTSYGNNGTLVNGVDCTVTGINGKGCTFDGVDDYIVSSKFDSIINGSSLYTFSVWVQTNKSNQTAVIIAKGESIDSETIIAYVANNYYFFMQSHDSSNVKCSMPINTTDSNWHYLVGVRDSPNSCKFYFDGELVNSTVSSSNISIITTNNVTIGVHSTLGNLPWAGTYFNGSIDEVAIYSKALSEEEIRDLYNSQRAKFIEFKTSKLDKSVEFDGVDDYINITNQNNLNNLTNITVMVWSENHIINSRNLFMEKHSSPTLGWWFAKEANNELIFIVVSSANRYTQSIIPMSNSYSYLVGMYDGVNVNLFMNNYNVTGLQLGTGSGQITNSANNLVFGLQRWGVPDYFYGEIDEVRIYNRTLSEDEIKTLYWYSIKPVEDGISEIDVSSCNLVLGEYYDVVAFSDKNRVEMKVVAK